MIAYVENSARPETWARDTGAREHGPCTRLSKITPVSTQPIKTGFFHL